MATQRYTEIETDKDISTDLTISFCWHKRDVHIIESDRKTVRKRKREPE